MSTEQIKPFDIIKVVSQVTGIHYDDMQALTRKREIVFARQLAMTLMLHLTTLSQESIGFLFGGRDHSTVIHARDTITDLCDTDSKVKDLFKSLEQMLTGENTIILYRKTKKKAQHPLSQMQLRQAKKTQALDIETIRLLSLGYSVKEIAEYRHGTVYATNSRIEKIRKKMKCKNTIHTVAFAIRSKMIS